MSAILSLLWSQFGGWIITVGTAIAGALGIYLKGHSDQKAKAKLKDLEHAIEIDKKADAARKSVAADPVGSLRENDGFRRD